jgi:hypothetical protein
MGLHSDPFVVDWDGDGDLDLLSGTSNGDVYWSENTAGPNRTPTLKPFVALIQSDGRRLRESRPDEVEKPLMSTRVWAADVNADGKVDLLVGDNSTLIYPAPGISEDDFAKRYAAWKKEYLEIGHKSWNTEEDRRVLDRQMAELREQRKSFIREERAGFVWVYLRK